MKKALKATMCSVLLISLITFPFFVCDYAETHYTRKSCEIVFVGEDTLKIKDRFGHLWEFSVPQNVFFEVGETVNLKMHTNHTSHTIQDDKVLKVERVRK